MTDTEIINFVQRCIGGTLDALADEIGKPMDRSLTPVEIAQRIRNTKELSMKVVVEAMGKR